jgi:threonyl-tRNA synthetase
LEYAKEVFTKLENAGIRAKLDDRNEKLGYKIRESIVNKNPYTLILGQKELDSKNISYRMYPEEDTHQMGTNEFIQKLIDDIKARK